MNLEVISGTCFLIGVMSKPMVAVAWMLAYQAVPYLRPSNVQGQIFFNSAEGV